MNHPGTPVILFDGICNLCNRSVQYVIQHDPEKKFRFASFQSETGQKIIEKYFPGQDRPGTFALVENGAIYLRSEGALRVARQLKGPVKLFYGFIIVPLFIRDSVYNWISRNRFRWFGKREKCMIPDPSISERFLS